MDLKNIETREELEKLADFLSNQGFGYINTYDLHQRKINSIINNNNKLNVNVDNRFKEKMHNMKDYVEADKLAKEHFSKFNPNDRIFELMSTFYLSKSDNSRVPSTMSPEKKEIINWVKFKKKYGLKDEYKDWSMISVYDLSKNILKIHFGDNNYDFRSFYKLIFGEEYTNFSDNKYNNKYSVWQNIGEIEIKLFQNGYANIKGNLKKIKELYYKYLTKRNDNMVIFYNGKKELFKAKER